MPRVSDADQRLIQAALELTKGSSLGKLRMRDVAKKARVNLGMFHYHFKTKGAFNRRVLQESYDRFFKEFTLETSKEGDTLERLRGALLTLGRFARDNRRLLLGILQDVLDKDEVAMEFAKQNVPRHGKVMLDLIGLCQKEGKIKKLSITTLMPLFMGAVALPNLLLAGAEHLGVKPLKVMPKLLLERFLVSDEILKQRVDLVLHAVIIPKGGRK